MSEPARGRDTRERLLAVAEKEFARYGYAGAHLQSIAEQIGVQKTALYYYFPSKAALHTAVVEAMLRSFEAMMAEVLEAPGSHRERLEKALDAFNDLLAERPNYARILIRVFVEGGTMDAETIGPIIERVIGRLLEFHRSGVEAGEFAPRSSRHFFLSFFGMTVFTYATPGFASRILEVEDVYSAEASAWRRAEVRSLLLGGVIPREPED